MIVGFWTSHVIVAVPQEEYRKRINLVGEQQLGEQMLELWFDVKRIVWYIVIVLDVLQDCTEKHTYVEVEHGRHLTDIRRVQSGILR